MFNSASVFNQNLCAWNVSQVYGARHMFANANSFNQNLCVWANTFQYTKSYNGIFANSKCMYNADPTVGSQEPFCALIFLQPGSSCMMAANPPGSSGPTQQPNSNLPLTMTPAPWLIKFIDMKANFNFTAGSANEALVLTYEIGKGKDHACSLYAGLCLDPRQEISVVIKNADQIENSTTPAMSTLKVRYNFHTSLIASSNI